MNKVVSINLGGIPFTLDEDAFVHLQNYLDAIHRHFKKNEGYREITHDIEARLAELFQERLDRRSIVNLNDVEEAIAIMGKPEDFGAEPMEETSSERAESSSSSGFRTGKRLFRNPDDEVVGGVCSGISAYFGIQDPIWIRLLFVVLTLSGAFGIPIYLVLWILMPEAKTASDKLAMRGEPANVSNIGRVIQEEVNSFSEEMSKFSKDWQKKPSGKGQSSLGLGLRRVVQFAGTVLVALGHFLVQVGRPLLILVGVVLMLSLAFAWAGTVIGFFTAWPTLQILNPGLGLSNVLLPINLLFLVGIPLVGLILLIARIVFRTRISKAWNTGLAVFWGLNLVSLFALGSMLGRHFSEKAAVTQDILLSPESPALELVSSEVVRDASAFDLDGKVEVAKGQLFFKAVDLVVLPSENDQWLLRQKVTARGASEEAAREMAGQLDWAVRYGSNILRIPEGYVLRKGQEWRNQKVHLELYIPVGSQITFDERTAEMLRDTELAGGRYHPADEFRHPWKMTERGLECVGCPASDRLLSENNTEVLSEYGPYEHLHLRGPAQLSLERGDRFQFQMQGPDQALKGVVVSQKGKDLIIEVPEYPAGPSLRFYLKAPELKALTLEETGDVRLQGFALDSLHIRSRGRQQIKAELDARTLITEQKGRNELDLTGEVGQLKATISDYARLDVDEADLQQAYLQLTNHSQAVLPPGTKVTQETDNSSWVRQ